MYPDDSSISTEARRLLKGLLCKRETRFSLEEIKRHPFFQGVDWSSLGLAEAPFLP